jgi:undecaprenyl-diphosphatase
MSAPTRLRSRRFGPDPDAASRTHTLALAGMAAGSVSLLASFVARLDADEHWPIDHRVREALVVRESPRLRRALHIAGRTGTVGVYAPVAALAMLYVGRRRTMRRAVPIAAAVGGAATLGFLLKQLVRRPRPVGKNGPVNTHPSFPSGHASRATALVAILAYVAVRERLASPHSVVPLAAILALATGASRAYADAHWTTDVIGGWATGITSMAGAALLYERIRAMEHE